MLKLNNIKLDKLHSLASSAEPDNKKLIKRIKKKKPKNFDIIVHNLHNKAFNNYDCLTCGNCCRSLGPRITDKDIERIAKHLKIKQNDIIDKYLMIDDDKDYVFKAMPCPFIDNENYCSIYENRPKACREYPHTNRKRFIQLLDLSLKNTYTCPVVYWIFENLKEEYR